MIKKIIKTRKKILGFITEDKTGQHWYAFGRPSQSFYFSYACDSVEHGEELIKQFIKK